MSWISRQANFRHCRAHEVLNGFDAPCISILVAFAGWYGVVMFAPLNILDARYCYQVFQYCNIAGRLKAFKSPTMDFALKTPTFFSDSDHFCRCQRWRAKRSLRGHFALHKIFFAGFVFYVYIYIYTPKPGRSPTRQYGVLRPFLTCAPSLDFFWVFQEYFSSCNSESSQSRASGWKTLDGLTAQVTLHVWACVKYVPKQSIP